MSKVVIPIQVQDEQQRQRKRRQPKGRALDLQVLESVRQILGVPEFRRDHLIEYLHRIQDHEGHLSVDSLHALAHLMGLAQTEVFEVASFYHHFDIVREGEAAPAAMTVRVCESVSCDIAGARELIERLPSLLGAEVRVQAVPCVGRCDTAPAVIVGQYPVLRADADKVLSVVHSGQTSHEALQPILYDDYLGQGGYRILDGCLSGRFDVEQVIGMLEHSGLRGLGGAGFPAARKWRSVRKEAGPRLMAVNIDEGEPGTFKDRHYLERDPHRFLEGMLIAAWAVGIDQIYIYVRDEYPACRHVLQQAIGDLRDHRNSAGLPEIELRRGAGAYICGEESAMIESIEGKRGLPRLRPPYVAQVGLFGRPTLEHNFETLYWVRTIMERGPEWFSGHGRHGRTGLRSYSVSGRVKCPGVHVAPAGITVQELIDEYCGGMQDGHEFRAYLPGGASGGLLPASMNQIPLDFDTLQEYGCFIGSAAVIVLSDHDHLPDVVRNLIAFFRHESCGQCTPCRVGTAKLSELLERDTWDLPLIEDLMTVMRDASICGLGQAAPNPLACLIKYFPEFLS